MSQQGVRSWASECWGTWVGAAPSAGSWVPAAWALVSPPHLQWGQLSWRQRQARLLQGWKCPCGGESGGSVQERLCRQECSRPGR